MQRAYPNLVFYNPVVALLQETADVSLVCDKEGERRV